MEDKKAKNVERAALRDSMTRELVYMDHMFKHRYMVTIRKYQVKAFVCMNDLDDVLMELTNMLLCKVSDIVYEIDRKYNQLHLHCIISTINRVRFRHYSKILNYRVYWSPIYSLIKVRKYLSKQVTNDISQQQLIADNYYHHNYGFV